VGITCAILVVLFAFQRFGTQKISFIFSPVVMLWLLANCMIGESVLSLFVA
jgi:KUP system potassium uptake protein